MIMNTPNRILVYSGTSITINLNKCDILLHIHFSNTEINEHETFYFNFKE